MYIYLYIFIFLLPNKIFLFRISVFFSFITRLFACFWCLVNNSTTSTSSISMKVFVT